MARTGTTSTARPQREPLPRHRRGTYIVSSAAGKVSTALRWGGDVEAARAELAEAKILAFVDAVLAEAPPLTDEQRQRIAAALGS